MKNINKIIHFKMIEISILIAVIMISFPIWKTLEKKEMFSIVDSYADVQFSYLEIKDNQKSGMYPMKNETALKEIQPTELRIINETKTEEAYVLYMSISKSSTLDYHCLNIALNNEVKPLSSLLSTEDDENYYFSITNGTLVGETRSILFQMWMDETTGNEMQGKTLSYSFELQKQMSI